MPTYDFEDTNTGETFEALFSFAEREEFLFEHPHMRQLPPTQINIVSGVSGVTHKVDSGWKDTLQRIGAANPSTPLADKVGGRSVKETRTAQAVAKWRKKRQQS